MFLTISRMSLAPSYEKRVTFAYSSNINAVATKKPSTDASALPIEDVGPIIKMNIVQGEGSRMNMLELRVSTALRLPSHEDHFLSPFIP